METETTNKNEIIDHEKPSKDVQKELMTNIIKNVKSRCEMKQISISEYMKRQKNEKTEAIQGLDIKEKDAEVPPKGKDEKKKPATIVIPDSQTQHIGRNEGSSEDKSINPQTTESEETQL